MTFPARPAQAPTVSSISPLNVPALCQLPRGQSPNSLARIKPLKRQLWRIGGSWPNCAVSLCRGSSLITCFRRVSRHIARARGRRISFSQEARAIVVPCLSSGIGIQVRTKQERNWEFSAVRNNVPGGENVGEFLPSGVERAGGARVEGLIEQLRERICVLEQVSVSLAFLPAPDAGLPRPACCLLFGCSFTAVVLPA